STNGSFINGEKISESVLKPGQTLKLGQIELQLLTEGMPVPPPKAPASAPAPGSAAPAPAPTPTAPGRKPGDSTMAMSRGVNLNELSEGARPTGFDTSAKGFSKKKNQTNKMFLIGAGVAVVVIVIVLVVVFSQLH